METSRSEIYRYLGLGSRQPDERTRELVENCLAELQGVISPRFFAREFPLHILPDQTVDLGCFSVKSRALCKNLDGCEKVILFAATLGMGPDRLIRRYSVSGMSRAVVLQAASAAMIEACCNGENARLRDEYAACGYFLRPRFSPGYGDFPLECQPSLLGALEAGKTVGITLTDSLLMIPSKSVTAVIGAGRTRCGGGEEGYGAGGCEVCGSQDCPYRRG